MYQNLYILYIKTFLLVVDVAYCHFVKEFLMIYILTKEKTTLKTQLFTTSFEYLGHIWYDENSMRIEFIETEAHVLFALFDWLQVQLK